jgi:predicted amidohydrolase
MICMDRNFPEVSRTLRLRGANLIIVPSYGGSSLDNEWRMRIRAGDDECFLCFVHPKVGLIVNPQGEIVGKLDAEKPGVLVEEVDMFDTTRIKIAHRRPELYKLSEQANCSPA